ncbi:MAG: hypothetical protein IKN91_04415 [Paludibacteraceae bacterium]|nr:hypothetical protein [Paludibacteraceae bacterium]
MKRSVIFLFYVLIGFGIISAQSQPAQRSEQQGNNERALQMANHYVQKFALNEDEAEQFIEIYIEYNKKLHAVSVLYRHESPKEGAMSDADIEERILNNFAQSRAILYVREKYYKEFRSVLTPSQINMIFEDEKARRAKLRERQSNNH